MEISSSSAGQSSDAIELRHAATDHATIVRVPERRLLAIDGVGSPASAGFRLATTTLRSAGEHLRRRLREDHRLETRVGLIECAWWLHPEVEPDEMADAFVDRTTWHWQQMIEIPAMATDDEAQAAIEATQRDAGREIPLIRVISFVEGRAAQILHLGGSSTEVTAVRLLYRVVADAGLRPRGHLHELYLADPEHVPAERVRAILRLPIED